MTAPARGPTSIPSSLREVLDGGWPPEGNYVEKEEGCPKLGLLILMNNSYCLLRRVIEIFYGKGRRRTSVYRDIMWTKPQQCQA